MPRSYSRSNIWTDQNSKTLQKIDDLDGYLTKPEIFKTYLGLLSDRSHYKSNTMFTYSMREHACCTLEVIFNREQL